MKAVRKQVPKPVSKVPTGIAGLDEITGGGLPRGRSTLVVGGPGAGKTLLSLEFLVHGAQDAGEPGIFVAFEEQSSRIVANCASFGWNLNRLQPRKLCFVDAQPQSDLVVGGTFDLDGLLAGLTSRIRETGARRIVFDALDILLDLLPDAEARKREIYKLHEWLMANEITGIITAKSASDNPGNITQQPLGYIQFMVDCAVILRHAVNMGVSQRTLRVQKYRGSSFDENESPFVIGSLGFEVGVARTINRADARATSERVATGVQRLDTMLQGGYYRGASVLITGFPGTAKTTLAAAFAEAACRRGEKTLFISFDSDGAELTRNLQSVGIRLDAHVRDGTLRLISARGFVGAAGAQLVRIKMLAKQHRARCLVIDPISTLVKSTHELNAHSVSELLVDWTKTEQITSVCTSEQAKMEGGALVHFATLADTWIELSYLAQGGERNRGLTILKSRGTAHSNQVGELLLSGKGVALAEPYTAGGEVLMGTLRREKEAAARAAHTAFEASNELRRVRLGADEIEIIGRLKSLQAELLAKQLEKTSMDHVPTQDPGQPRAARHRSNGLRSGAPKLVGE